jgi:RimJ/RimL family protein N-acetyltransferase
MPDMIKRWLRDRLEHRIPKSDTDQEDDERKQGSLVRKGRLVALRTHVPGNRAAFQRWYADPEIAGLLRHDLEPLSMSQSRAYFDTFIIPSSARGLCFAIHERETSRLVGTTALTDREKGKNGESALFRIVIGEKDCWNKGYGTEATRLVMEEAFDTLGLSEVRLEVFHHNDRAIAAYGKVGFRTTGEHVEWVSRRKTELRVIEMRLTADALRESVEGKAVSPDLAIQRRREKRKRRRAARAEKRDQRQAMRHSRPDTEAARTLTN